MDEWQSASVESNEKDLYFVAVKLFLRDGEMLLITHDIFGSWDLPGGRLKKDEFETPLEQVIKRKIDEELGSDVSYDVGEPCIFFRVERQEHGLNGKKVRIFAIGYDAEYTGGEIKTGKNHDRMEWVNLAEFKPEEYFTGGWLHGIEEYLRLQG